MTKSTSVKESGVQGDLLYLFATVNITSLANAGNEPFDPEAIFDELNDVHGVAIVGVENADSYQIEFDHLANQLTVVNVADGTNVAAATAVGEVRVKVEGE